MARGINVLVISILVCVGASAQVTTQATSRPTSRPTMPPNPEYLQWSGFKPGAVVKRRMRSEASGVKTETVVTYTLKELNKEKAIVDSETVLTTNGKESKLPPVSRAIAAKVRRSEAERQSNPPGKTGEGEEELEILGRKLKTKWVESETTTNEVTTRTKTWTSDEIPGGVVKRIQSTRGKIEVKSEEELLEVKAEAKGDAKAP